MSHPEVRAAAAETCQLVPAATCQHAGYASWCEAWLWHLESTSSSLLAPACSPQVADYRRQLGVRVSGFDGPRPVRSFAQCGFDAPLMQACIYSCACVGVQAAA